MALAIDHAGLVHLTEAGLQMVKDQARAEGRNELWAEITKSDGKSAATLERECIGDGITLKGDRLRQAQHIASECGEAMRSVQRLSITAICSTESADRDALLTAMEGMAKWTTRRVDVLLELLDWSCMGNYSDDLHAKPEAKLETTEAEHA